MSDNDVIIGLATIVVFGVGAQWIGRRLAIPSLLLLLPAGLLAGDVLGLVDPEALFGESLFPGITLLVSLLLFQSALQLRFAELPRVAQGSVLRLITVGLTVTFLGATLAVLLIFEVGSSLAWIVGAIVVVSGPTVVGPLLGVVRPKQPTGSILRWEGTILDPLGATLGVVVLNLVLASDRGGVHPVLQMFGRLGVGVAVGLAAAAIFVFAMSRFLVTDDMEAAVALLFAVGGFAVAEVVLSEAGLFATTTMGLVLANQARVSPGRIGGFGETLEVLIIGPLFIVLGALVTLDELESVAGRVALLVAVLVVVVRPLASALSLLGTSLPRNERAMIGWVDPRGVIAAATAAQFGGTLDLAGFDADFLTPTVFGVILGTGIVYGLTARPVARVLRVIESTPTGVAFLGATPWILDLARTLQSRGVPVLMLVTTADEVAEMARAGLPAAATLESGRAAADAIRGASIAQVLVTGHLRLGDRLLISELVELLGRRNVLRLPNRDHPLEDVLPESWTGHAFARGTTLEDIEARIRAGARVQVLDGTAGDTVMLASIRADGTVNLTPGDHVAKADTTRIGFVADAPR